MPGSLLIKDIDIVFPNEIRHGDVLINHGKIVDVDWQINCSAEQIIRESGLTLMPGVIDPHVHFRQPGLEYKEDIASGSRAGAAGGVTSFLEMPNTDPLTTTVDRIAEKKQIASKVSLINYNFFIGATADNVSEVVRCPNIPGVKLYLGLTTGGLVVDQPSSIQALVKQSQVPILVHSEFAETKMMVELALKYKKRVHICHLSSQEEIQLFSANKPAFVSCEVTPQHLLLSDQDYDRLGALMKVNPPIRSIEHQAYLVRGVRNGIIDCIATDHAPHLLSEKLSSQPPSGMPGIETSLPLLLDWVNRGGISLPKLTTLMSVAPASLFHLSQKGQIAKGFDADLVLVDLKAARTVSNTGIYSKCGWSAFEGRQVQGWPMMTIVNGNTVFREGDFFTDIPGREIVIR